jgi:hypothetical protein
MMHFRMNCEEGEAREGEGPSSLLRGMGSFHRATTYLEFRTVDDVEGRMETHSSLTKTFEWIFLRHQFIVTSFSKDFIGIFVSVVQQAMYGLNKKSRCLNFYF